MNDEYINSNNRLTRVLQTTLEGFWIVNSQAQIIEVNDTYLKMIGYSRDEFQNIKIFDVEAVENPEETQKHIEKIITTGSDIFETKHRKKDGTIIIVEISVTYLAQNGGEFICFLRNITTQKRTESLLNARIQLSEISQTSDLDILIRSALDIAESITESSIGFFHFVNEDQENLKLQTWSTNTLKKMCTAEGKGQHYPISHAGVWVECIRARCPVVHNDYATLPNKKGLPEGHAPITRELTIPIIRNNKIVAIIGLGNKKTLYMQEDIESVSILSSMAIDLVERKKAEDDLIRTNKELEQRVTERTETLNLTNEKLHQSIIQLESLAELNQKIITSSPLGKLVYSINDGKCVVVNDSAMQMFEMTKDDILSINLFDFAVWKQKDYAQILHESITNKTESKLQVSVKINNENKWFDCNLSFFKWDNENHILICFENITDRKFIENILLENEEKFRIAFENAPTGMSMIKPNGEYIAVNPMLCKMFGYSEKELMSGTINKITHPDDIERGKEWIQKRIKGDTNEIELEKRYIHKDGHIVWGLVRAEWIKTENGESFMSIVHISDITERKKMMNELQENEEKFRSLYENITEGVALHEIIYDNNGQAIDYKILDVNQSYKTHTGLDPEIAKNKLGSELYGLAEPPYLKEYANVAKTRIPSRFETFFPPMEKYFNISIISPKKGQFATVFEDITATKKREQEILQKNEELTRFIYTVSHDLKSPLVTIKAFTSYLQEDIEKQDKEAQNTDIGYINNAADKMGLLLEELLELSRIGRKENIKTEETLAFITQEAIDLVAGQINEGNVNISVNQPKVKLYGDTRRLIQLFQNLIDNAVKYMGNQSKPTIEIGAIPPKEPSSDIILYVKDNGMGIDVRYHHKIFGLFEKLDASKEGTGIGLALVKRIVEVHNGKIWFESEGIGKGTTFYFTFEKTKWE
jgi:PAS domain S-box-containing protein